MYTRNIGGEKEEQVADDVEDARTGEKVILDLGLREATEDASKYTKKHHRVSDHYTRVILEEEPNWHVNKVPFV